MLRRFIFGGLLGCLLGLGLGVGVAYLLRVSLTPLLGSLVAAAVGGTVLVLVRRPPWRQGSALESLLRVVLGMILGSGLHYVLRRFADVDLPFRTPPLGAGVHLPEHPVLLGAIVGTAVGILVGVEPSPPKATPTPPKAEPKTSTSTNSSGIETV